MKNSIRISAAVALAAAAILAPAAAQAVIYPPSGACTVTPATVTPGGTVAFECDDETFGATESVTITVEGATGATVGFVKFAVTSSGGATSTASGALAPVDIAFPSDASGVYNISAVSETSSGGTSSVSVTSGSTGGGSLPATGADNSALLGVWVGGGALVLAGGALAVAATVRRNRNSVDA
ncbi:LPXTG cell wall anchor domain-containing protein [Microbacterium lacus]|uniref:LPXTG cell wall anchor domain-containing protein n=1 Tax=Microbacterium lacus TaxID=415217 RepID=UPI00384F2603